MSVKIMSQIWELDLPAGEKLIALGFADHANDEGICRPSFSRIAWKCGVSRATVKRMVRRFQDAGILARMEMHAGHRSPLWRVIPENGAKLSRFVSDLERSRGVILTPLGVKRVCGNPVEKPVEAGKPENRQRGHGDPSAASRGVTAVTPESKALEPKERGVASAAAPALPVENVAQLELQTLC